MKRLALGMTAVALLLVSHAVAQQQVGPNGGWLAGPADGHQAELLLSSPIEASIYIIEKGKVHATDGAKARLVIMQAGKTKNVDLVDDQGKRLVGKLDTPLEPGTIVVLSGKDKHGDGLSARFIVK